MRGGVRDGRARRSRWESRARAVRRLAMIAEASSYHSTSRHRPGGRCRAGSVDERERRLCEVARVGGAAALVVDDAQLLELAAEPEHRAHEVLAARSEHPGGTHDERVRMLLAHRELARELRCAVDGAGPRRVGLHVAVLRVAREHVVGRVRDECGSGGTSRPGDVARAVSFTATPPRGRTPRRRRRSRRRRAGRASGGTRDRARTAAASRTSSSSRVGASVSAAATSGANSAASWPRPPVTNTRMSGVPAETVASRSTTAPRRAGRPSARSARRDRRGRTPR